MSKKLLSEAQVRRFQTLATIRPLNEAEYNEELYEEEEEEGMEMDAADEEGEDMGDADVELDEELVEKFMEAAATIQEVADALGGGAGAEMDMGGEDLGLDAGEEDLGLDAGAEEGGEDLALDAGEEDLGDEEEEEEMLQEALRGISYVPSQKEVVKLVAKRVARRLQEAKRAEHRLNRALGKRR